MFKGSTLPCQNLCWFIVRQSRIKQSGIALVSRTNSTFTPRWPRISYTQSVYEKNSDTCCWLPKSYYRHNKRCYSTEFSIEKVEDYTDLSTNADINKLVDELIENAIERDRMISVVPRTDIHEQVVKLVEAGLHKSNILNLHRYPELMKNLAQLTDLITVLLQYGVPKENISTILKTFPNIVYKTEDDVLTTIKKLYSLGFSSESMIEMICNYPDLLDNDLSLASQRIEDLKTLFKTKDTYKFLERSPHLLFCDFDHILQRYNYVYAIMGITQPQMRHSKLFSYPLDHIHARHMFVERAGFFKKFAKKKGQIDTNPTLDTIIDTTDAEFVKKFGKMSVKDYHTFKKLLLKDRIIATDSEDSFED
ncbi:transcription termination factor 4, mitochondrial-like [Ruditapes philippinarum]|uniref:transcription termination factor 4, mitochondrial-like n=1 Tax=Ruditapes philippinarum TaxID=129788 RepID=UPI00295A9ADA|nr:transcription termination factor 4, mitochondrial-like [Ruditapes philippinarum]